MSDSGDVSQRTLDFNANGIQLRADSWGNPAHRPVILAHGGGQTRHSWGRTAARLAQNGWYAVAYDHRGHGESDWSPDGEYGIDLFAEDLRSLARQFSQRPAVVGASLGGLAAMLAEGEGAGQLLSSLVMVDITPNMDPEGAMNIIRFMDTHLQEGFADLDEAAEVIARYTGRPRRDNTRGLEKNLRLCDDGRYRWHWDPRFIEMRRDKLTRPGRLLDAVKNIHVPMMLVRGRLSEVVTEPVAQEFLRQFPHVEYVDVENARHMVAGDRNDIFTAAVLTFLGKADSGSD